MSMSDPLGDMITRIRNAQRSRHAMCVAPASKLRANVLEALKREGFIRGYAAEELRPGVAQLRIELKYNAGEQAGAAGVLRDQGAAEGVRRAGGVDPVDAAGRAERRRGACGQRGRRSAVPGILGGMQACLV